MRRQKLTLGSVDLDRYGIDLSRLVVSMARSRKVLQRYREEYREAVRQDAGSHYSDDGTRQKVPINLIGLYEQIVGTALISSNPRIMLSTFQQQLRPAVEAMQQWANRQIERMNLAEALKRIVNSSLYSIGIAKVALASPTDAATLAWGVRAGEALVSPIDLDDWVYDTHANRFEEVSYMAHRFRVPLDAVKDSKLYDGKSRRQLEPSPEQRYNQEGDERVHQIGKGLWWQQDDFEDMVDLWEVYLPRHRLVVTVANDIVVGPALVQTDGLAEPLRVQRWIGPDTGPYHLLGLKTVSGNAMPKGPILSLIDMHEIANRTFRKLDRQAERQKTNVWYQRGADGDAKRINDGNDGDAIGVDRPDQIKETRLGGPDQQNFQFFEEVLNRFSWLAGNLDILGGLSPQAKTLGQDKMLNQNSSRVVSGMQDQCVNYVAGVAKALCWYWWHDPYKVMNAPYSPKGLDNVQVERQLHPADPHMQALGELTRHGSFDDLDIQVDPYSLQHLTPQERMAALDQMVMQVIIPLLPLLQQNGIVFDVKKYLEIKAKYSNIPELQDIVTMGQATPPPEAGGQEEQGALGPQPPQDRHYIRENRSERTNQGTTQNLLTALGGVHPGGNETSAGQPRRSQ